jgi:hypothetical protein
MNLDKLKNYNYKPEQIEAKFQSVEQEIKKHLPPVVNKNKAGKPVKMNINQRIKALTTEQFKHIVEVTFNKILNLFLGFESLKGFVKHFLGVDLEFVVQDTLEDKGVAMLVQTIFRGKKIVGMSIRVAKKYLSVYEDAYITFTSGVKTKSLVRAFIVTACHELIHVLLRIWGTEKEAHGKEFLDVGKSLFGMTDFLFDTDDVIDVEKDTHELEDIPIKKESNSDEDNLSLNSSLGVGSPPALSLPSSLGVGSVNIATSFPRRPLSPPRLFNSLSLLPPERRSLSPPRLFNLLPEGPMPAIPRRPVRSAQDAINEIFPPRERRSAREDINKLFPNLIE